MDPVTVLGILGSVVSIGDVVGKNIKKLTELKSAYRNIPFRITILIGQLHITQVAIDQLASTWSSPNLERNPRYQQLAVQMGSALECLTPLLLALQEKLENVNVNKDLLTVKNKLSFLWNEKEMDNYFVLVDRQINALNLLVQAIQCNTWAEQRGVIDNNESQHIIQLAQDCSSSIIGLSDKKSIVTENIDGLSVEFEFDTLITGCKPYMDAYRSHLRQAIQPMDLAANPHSPPMEYIESSNPKDIVNSDTNKLGSSATPLINLANVEKVSTRNSMMDHATTVGMPSVQPRSNIVKEIFDALGKIGFHLSTHSLTSVRPAKVKTSILGISGAGKTTLLEDLYPLMRKQFSREHRLTCRANILSNLVQSFKAILEIMESLELSIANDEIGYHARAIYACSTWWGIDSFNPEIVTAIKALWFDEGLQMCYKQHGKYQIFENLEYFMNSIERLEKPDYIPSSEDVLRAHVETTGIAEYSFTLSHLSQRLIDIGGRRSERNKWDYALEGAKLVVYVVDASGYDRPLWEDATTLRILESLEVFEDTINSTRLTGARFLLVFSHMDILEQHLSENHPARYFPDFRPREEQRTPTVDEWITYLQFRFTSLIRSATHRDTIRIVRANLVDFRANESEVKELLQSATPRAGIRTLRTNLICC